MQTARDSHQILIVGGGASGIAVASELSRRDRSVDVAVIEPSDVHEAKALLSSVGAGIHELETTRRAMRDILPDDVRWIQARAAAIDPDHRFVELDSGTTIGYEFLVVCTGVQVHWDWVPGLQETIGRNGVCSTYSSQHAAYAWETLKVLESGHALFALQASPFACAGTSFELMFLTADNLDQRGRLDRTDVELFSPDVASQFEPLMDGPLQSVFKRYGIQMHRSHRLVEVDGDARTAVFEYAPTGRAPERVERPFDLLHVVPRQGPSEVILNSELADGEGWLDVSHATHQHTRYPNVFGAGDAVGGTFLRSIFGVPAQAAAVAENVLDSVAGGSGSVATIAGDEIAAISTGYSRAIRLRFNERAGSARKTEIAAGSDSLLSYWKFKKSLPRKYWTELLKGGG